MSQTLGIIGLGRVGLPAAKAWLTNGYKVCGYDPNPAAMKEFASAGGVPVATPREVARRAPVVIVLVLDDEQVNEVFSGKEGILKEEIPGAIVICMSTIRRDTVVSVAGLCEGKKIGFIDCPFTGGPARIPSGNLTLIAAGLPRVLASVKTTLEVIGKIVHAGDEPGQGQAVKHCNQLLVGATHAATMEVITLARRLGLDPSLVRSVIADGIAGSDYFRLLSESVLKKTPSPGRLGQMCKDMEIVTRTAEAAGMDACVASAANRYFTEAKKQGMSDREGADLIDIVEQHSGSLHKDKKHV
ncbi:MAG TPA: NAD(P)-dependent oxidoreductase [Chryseosolibacter sp.]